MPTVCFERTVCDQCAVDHRLDDLVDSAVRRVHPGWKSGERFPPSHAVWDLHRRLWEQFSTNCVTVTDYDGIEVVSLCQTHLNEYAEELADE